MLISHPDTVEFQDLEDQLRKVLRTSALIPAGRSKGGLISHSQSFDTDWAPIATPAPPDSSHCANHYTKYHPWHQIAPTAFDFDPPSFLLGRKFPGSPVEQLLIYGALGGQSNPIPPVDMLISHPDTVEFQDLEDQLRKVLRTSALIPAGRSKGGLISHSQSFDTDWGRVFVKMHRGAQARTMFAGEIASLEAIGESNTVRVTEPIAVRELPTGGAMLVLKHLPMRSISRFAETLGDQLAEMHLHNLKKKNQMEKQNSTIGSCPADLQVVEKFGFHTVTCCGYIPQVNEWQKDWVTFFICQRLKPQIDLIEKEYGDRNLQHLWSELQVKVHNAFKDTVIVPSLLHGDFWEANVAEDDSGPVLFDPGSFYGHSEYELAIGDIFGVNCGAFYSAYHRRIPRTRGFETRQKLYQLFHFLNNWNHFGLEFRESSLNQMKILLNIL
ncbi:ketosamine-3-kinase-like [Pelodytes ibericus]